MDNGKPPICACAGLLFNAYLSSLEYRTGVLIQWKLWSTCTLYKHNASKRFLFMTQLFTLGDLSYFRYSLFLNGSDIFGIVPNIHQRCTSSHTVLTVSDTGISRRVLGLRHLIALASRTDGKDNSVCNIPLCAQAHRLYADFRRHWRDFDSVSMPLSSFP